MTLIDNLVIPQGAAWDRTYTITNPTNGQPLDLTGYTAKAQIRATPLGPVLFEWRTNPSAGQGTITLTTGFAKLALTGVNDSVNWVFTRGEWDLFLTSAAGAPARLVKGISTVEPAITR